MYSTFEIDETDVKILQALIRNDRSKLKEIAIECRLSSTAVKNRIDRMKKNGLIVRSVLKF
jgi:DNA-binding Lrp family transcriptional regulator